MGRHWTTSNDKLAGGVLLGTVASGLASAALSGAATATATCASIDGMNNGNGCTSTATSVAIGIGNGATATSSGMFDTAVADGTNSFAQAGNPATGTDMFNTAFANGTGAVAVAGNGNNDTAYAIGNPGPNPTIFTLSTNPAVAVASGTSNSAFALGNGAVAIGSGTNNTVQALGDGSTAIDSCCRFPDKRANALLAGDPSVYLAATPGLFGTGSNNIAIAQGTNQIGFAEGDNHIAINGENNIK
jgi:hypothetical protein